MVAAPKPDPYRFEEAFEKALVAACCRRPRLFGRIGKALDPELLSLPASRLAIRAVKAIDAEAGSGPGSPLLVLQRLARWRHEGQVTDGQIREVAMMIDEAEDAGIPDDEEIVFEIRPVLQQRLRTSAVYQALDELGRKGDFASVSETLISADRVGSCDDSVGTAVGEGSFACIERASKIERLPTGIMELDLELDGGLPRGCLGMVVAGSKVGKSMFLSHVAACAMRHMKSVVYATLELPESEILCRLKSAITGVRINDLKNGQMPVAKERLLTTALGPCVVKHWPAQATTVRDLREWIKRCAEHFDKDPEVIIVDYGDKLTIPNVTDRTSGYQIGLLVFEGLRHFAEEKNNWVWTASQAKRSTDSKTKIKDIESVADSMHKSRVVDLVVTLNPRDEATQVLYHVAGFRYGRTGGVIGPLPTDFECGRMCTWADSQEG